MHAAVVALDPGDSDDSPLLQPNTRGAHRTISNNGRRRCPRVELQLPIETDLQFWSPHASIRKPAHVNLVITWVAMAQVGIFPFPHEARLFTDAWLQQTYK